MAFAALVLIWLHAGTASGFVFVFGWVLEAVLGLGVLWAVLTLVRQVFAPTPLLRVTDVGIEMGAPMSGRVWCAAWEDVLSIELTQWMSRRFSLFGKDDLLVYITRPKGVRMMRYPSFLVPRSTSSTLLRIAHVYAVQIATSDVHIEIRGAASDVVS